MTYFIIKKEKDRTFYSEAHVLSSAKITKILNETRLQIIKMLTEKPLYPKEIAKKLGINEQKVYYHINPLIEENIIEIFEKKEIRGTIARKLKAKTSSIISLQNPSWKVMNEDKRGINPKIISFFKPFIEDSLSGKIVVGSPDPHGPFKARARDGHYAIDFSMFLGSLVSLSDDFSVFLDVDTNLQDSQTNLILVGGPVTNLLTEQINSYLPISFSKEDNWALKGKKHYTEDNIGLIARIPNPFNPQKWVIVIAGVKNSGTKAAVIGITRQTDLILNRFSDQKRFCAIVEGFDLNADGRIDHVELRD
jgi:DNA-binding transcriptional ArsR family regulator